MSQPDWWPEDDDPTPEEIEQFNKWFDRLTRGPDKYDEQIEEIRNLPEYRDGETKSDRALPRVPNNGPRQIGGQLKGIRRRK